MRDNDTSEDVVFDESDDIAEGEIKASNGRGGLPLAEGAVVLSPPYPRVSRNNGGFRQDITPHPSDLEETPIWSTASRQPIHLTVPGLGSKRLGLPGGITHLSHEVLDDIIAGGVPSERYQRRDHLGTGGMGQVYLVWDSLLRRDVALKVPQDKLNKDRTLLRAFVLEALMTAQLEHPNIISSYDMTVEDGQLGFVMRRLKGERLSSILQRLARGSEVTLEKYGRVRLLNIFQQIASAVAYAHDRNIIHRDLKPANVMVGSYGEVQVIDWGLAMMLGPEGSSVGGRGLKGAQVGQPPYMSPEQFYGLDDSIDFRSDIYSLGAMLYEFLTLEKLHAFIEDEPLEAYMERCLKEPVLPPSERAPSRKISQGLDEICMRCLNPDPGKRYQQASDLLAAVIIELEGSREREFGRKAAGKAVEVARERVSEYEELLKEVRQLTRATRDFSLQVKGYHSIERKRELWDMEDRLRQRDHDLAVAFHAAEHAFHQALGYDADSEDAQAELLDFYYRRFLREEEDRGGGREYFAARVYSFGDPIYDGRMRGDGTIEVLSDPPGAQVELLTFESRDRVLKPVLSKVLGSTPVKVDSPMGSYLLRLRAEGYESVLAPIQVGRLEAVIQRSKLPKAGTVAEGFVYVPEGYYIRGGDFEAMRSEEEQRTYVSSFAISRFPVTAGAFLEFLNEIWKEDPVLAERYAPRDNNTAKASWDGGGDKPYAFPEAKRDEHRWDPNLPVVNTSWISASAYARWYGERIGRSVRLPLGVEWEKAGRGVDGRPYPWGGYWDAGFCKNVGATQSQPYPEPVGAYPHDTSPYGVGDLAGGVHEWCEDWFSESDGQRLARGGSWAGPPIACRMASRYGFWPQSGHEALGFRLAYPIEGMAE